MPKNKGWRKESARHALASKGVKTKQTRKGNPILKVKLPNSQMEELKKIDEVVYIEYGSDPALTQQLKIDVETMKMGYRRRLNTLLYSQQYMLDKGKTEDEINGEMRDRYTRIISDREQSHGEEYAKLLLKIRTALNSDARRKAKDKWPLVDL